MNVFMHLAFDLCIIYVNSTHKMIKIKMSIKCMLMELWEIRKQKKSKKTLVTLKNWHKN